MEEVDKKQTIGKIVGVRGQIVIVECEGTRRPQLRELLTSPLDLSVKLEAHSYRGVHELYCLLLSPRQSIYRHMPIISTGGELVIPVGLGILGRVVDLHGTPQDNLGPLEDVELKSIYSSTTPREMVLDSYSSSTQTGVLETGIKAIDLFTPVPKGGKIGLVGGAGVGKTILMTEIMRNFNSKGGSLSVFAGIGERIREGHELWNILKRSEVLYRTVLILGGMSENAAVRFKIAWAAATIAEYFRDTAKQDVLFFVDNIFRFVQAGSELSTLLEEVPSEFGYQPTLQTEIAQFESRLGSGASGVSITSIQTVYVPSDTLTNPSVTATIPHLASVVILSRDIAHEGRLPAIDVFKSRSSVLDKDFLGKQHYETVIQATELLNRYDRLSRITAIIGEEELSLEDQKTYNRAQKILNYMTQPFYSTEQQTGRKGVFVQRATTIQDVKSILDGKMDSVPADKFLYIGDLKTAGLLQ